MRLLVISDIHGNVEAVRQRRGREANDYDAIVVAGDIGADAAAEIMAILGSFACPVLYVYGNWDRRLAYDAGFRLRPAVTCICARSSAAAGASSA